MAQKLFMDLAAHPQAILDAMDGMRPAIENEKRRQKRIWWIGILSAMLFFGGFFLGILLAIFFGGPGVGVGFVMILSGIILFIIWAVLNRGQKPIFPRFEAAYQVIHTLRDDVGRKGRLVGHLDLSKPNQNTKLFRTARTSSGNTKNYYRDPWFVARLKLVDGNVVKLVLEDRIKQKKGYFVYHLAQYQNKVIINPDLYQAVEGYDPAKPPILSASGQLDPKQLDVSSALENLKDIYTQAHPLEALASLPPASEVAPSESQPPQNPSIDEPGVSPAGAQPL